MKIEQDKCFAETKADSFSRFKPANRIIGCGKSAAVRKIRCYCRIMNWSGDLSRFFFARADCGVSVTEHANTEISNQPDLKGGEM